MVDFYTVYRAYVRGKVESFRSAEPEVAKAERDDARRVAQHQFDLAVRVAGRRQPPVLLITCGLPGTGKSALARAIGASRSMPVIASDVVRKELAGLRPTARQSGPVEGGIYTHAFTKRTYNEMFARCRSLLESGQSVILDATFPRRAWREQAAQLATATGALFLCLETRAPEDIVLERIARRVADPDAVSDAGIEVYRAAQHSSEPVTELPDWSHVVVDTSGTPTECADAASASLDERLHPLVQPNGQ